MFKLKKVPLLAGAALAVFGLTAVGPASVSAADFPSKPVQLQVPFAPGGGADRTFRLFAPYLAEELGQPVKVTNVAGGGGWVSWSQVVNDWNPRRDDDKLAVVNIPHIFSFLNPDMKRSEKAGILQLSWPGTPTIRVCGSSVPMMTASRTSTTSSNMPKSSRSSLRRAASAAMTTAVWPSHSRRYPASRRSS